MPTISSTDSESSEYKSSSNSFFSLEESDFTESISLTFFSVNGSFFKSLISRSGLWISVSFIEPRYFDFNIFSLSLSIASLIEISPLSPLDLSPIVSSDFFNFFSSDFSFNLSFSLLKLSIILSYKSFALAKVLAIFLSIRSSITIKRNNNKNIEAPTLPKVWYSIVAKKSPLAPLYLDETKPLPKRIFKSPAEEDRTAIKKNE